MAGGSRLRDHPGLEAWYAKNRQSSSDLPPPVAAFVRHLCESMDSSGSDRVHQLCSALERLFKASATPQGDFLAAQAAVQDCDEDLMDIISDVGRTAIEAGMGERFQVSMKDAADRTDLVAFRFLSAWTALNIGQLQTAVDECDRVTQPYSSVLTLQGQALLELGQVDEAIRILGLATTLGPEEILAWFQLAKANHIADFPVDALNALERCRRLAPMSLEVLTFMAMVACGQGVPENRRDDVWRLCLAPSVPADEPGFNWILLQLAASSGRRSDFDAIIAGRPWLPDGGLRSIQRELPDLLRVLHRNGWNASAAALLTQITPTAS